MHSYPTRLASRFDERQALHVDRTDARVFTPYFDVVRQGFVLIDESGHVLLCTRQARDLLGLSDVASFEGASVRRLMRAVRRVANDTWRDHRDQLRRIHPKTAIPFEIALQDRILEVGVCAANGHGWAVTLEDVSVRRAAEASAAEAARLDPLTGLPNRRHLRERLDAALARLSRTGEACAVLLVDLDRFKPVNDTLGHPVGDALLQTVADRLRSTLRPTDTVARIGGDEFVILQADVARADDVQTLARRIVDLVGRSYIVDGHLITIGASVGAALAPADGAHADTLLKNADLALYRAKLDGRGTFRFFEPGMDARMQARRQLELDMRQALARREFQLHYQPQLNLASNQLVGCEALIRWPHPQRGMVSPLDFIPLAEEIGLIVPIGEWVIR